jgi:hypothetical protein
MPSASRLPTATTFFNHVVVALGHLTGFRPHVYINHREVELLVLKQAQIDPHNCPWPLTGKPSLNRNIGFAHRNQRAGYTKSKTPLTELGDRGLWGLTEAGVKKAQSLVPQEMPKAARFEEPLLSVLGRLTDYGKRFVPFEGVKEAVLRAVGIDPSNLPAGWLLTTRRGVARRVTNMFRRLKKGARALTCIKQRGVWGLTKRGAERAREINHEVLPMPSAETFRDALLRVLGGLTRFDHRESIKASVVRHEVLEHLELDLADLPSHWTEEGLLRRLTNAFYSMSKTFTCSVKRGLWGLTRRGVRRVRRLLQNATSRWIGAQGAKFLTYLSEKVARKLVVSSTMGLVEDHVNTYLMKAIRRDAFAKMLAEKNGKIPWSKIVSYCVRSAYTDIRGEGTDAHCRTLRGSLTEQNRKQMAKSGVDDRRIPWTDPRVVLSRDDHGGVVREVVDEHGDMSWIDDRLDYERTAEALRAYAEERGDDALGKITDLLLNDYTTTEIAKALDIPRRESAATSKEVRRLAQQMLGGAVPGMVEAFAA